MNERIFKSADKDGDGRISKEELETFLQESGLDGDVFLDAYELLDGMEPDIPHVDQSRLIKEFERLVRRVRKQGNGGAVCVKEEALSTWTRTSTAFSPRSSQLPAHEDSAPLLSNITLYGSTDLESAHIPMKDANEANTGGGVVKRA